MKKTNTISELLEEFPKEHNGFTYTVDSASHDYVQHLKLIASLELKPDYKVYFIDGSHAEYTEKQYRKIKQFPMQVLDIEKIPNRMKLTCEFPANNLPAVYESMQKLLSYFNPLKQTFTPKGYDLLKSKDNFLGCKWCLESGRNEDMK